jgi:CRP-like cAMP-binding protein
MQTGRWFRSLPRDVQLDVQQSLRLRRYPSGAAVFRQDEPYTGLHCVLTGRVHVTGLAADGVEALMTILHAGDWTGFLASLDNGPHTLTASCVTDCTIGTLPRSAVKDIFERSVERYRLLVAPELIVARRNYRYLTNHHRSLPIQRLAYRLLDLLGGPHGDSHEARSGVIRVSQEQLGAATQLSRQKVNALLRSLEVRGLVECKRGAIRILDPEALRAAGLSN